ncbi:hypothetical protein [Flavilitoribacter nigricans]|nr:hypothetical protein [Flavilitoribacter nigricans]
MTKQFAATPHFTPLYSPPSLTLVLQYNGPVRSYANGRKELRLP